MMESNDKYFFDNPKNVKLVLNIFYVLCGLLFLLDFVIHRHVYHSLENIWGFYPIYGFVGCVVLVIIAKWMRLFIMRDEDYYTALEDSRHSVSVTSAEDAKGGHHVDH